MEVIRHGKYKSAVEPYLENKMSSDNRKQIKELLESIWETISGEISDSRGINDLKINQIAENLDANTPQKALNSNLIDLIIYDMLYESHQQHLQIYGYLLRVILNHQAILQAYLN